MPRTRGNGQGSVRKIGRKYYLRFMNEHGVRDERACEATSKTEALHLLAKKVEEAAIARGRSPIRTIRQLQAVVRRDRVALGKSVVDLDKRWKLLEPHFGDVDVEGVTTTALTAYREHRAAQYVSKRGARHVSKSTINREIACLRQLLRAGANATPRIVSWDKIPKFELADERDRIRTNFIDEDLWTMIRGQLAEHLVALFTVAYWLGWRAGELLTLQRSQVDLRDGTLRLSPGRTKNKEGRLVYLPQEALEMLREQERVTKAHERETQRLIPWVFHYRGQRIASYKTGWRGACRRAGLAEPYPRVHDFRRGAARAYIRAGVSEPVAMKITGHLTPAVFRRYNITNEPDLAAAAQQIHAAATKRAKTRRGSVGESGPK